MKLSSLEANPNYRGGAAKPEARGHPPRAGSLRRSGLPLEKGDVDIARNLTPDQVAGIAGNTDIDRHLDPAGAALLHRPQPEDRRNFRM